MTGVVGAGVVVEGFASVVPRVDVKLVAGRRRGARVRVVKVVGHFFLCGEKRRINYVIN